MHPQCRVHIADLAANHADFSLILRIRRKLIRFIFFDKIKRMH